MGRSTSLTEGIRIDVHCYYVPERSVPTRRIYFFAYEIRIANVGEEPAQLLSRHWIIRDGNGEEEHVRGPGVVGEQPYLAPGQQFEYTSACPLTTPIGSMRGTYQMVRQDGRRFDAHIGLFSLEAPDALN